MERVKMKQVVKVIKKHDEKKELARVLQLEVDYELSSLFDAMQQGNEAEANKSKERLAEISAELKELDAYYTK